MTVLRETEEAEVLGNGELVVRGRVLPASNLTFLGEVSHRGVTVPCVYKPVRGERPLWDFPDGTLAAREVAAHVVSSLLGWDITPATLLRDGPLGSGMVQAWKEPDAQQRPVDVVPHGEVPSGFRHVLDAVDHDQHPVSLVHEDGAALRRIAVFDTVVNNADRKGGHVLPMPDGRRHGVDHGLGFHEDDKLRTVLWGWAGERLVDEDAAAVDNLLGLLHGTADPGVRRLRELLAPAEVEALVRRCASLLARGTMPMPSAQWPAIPWPAF